MDKDCKAPAAPIPLPYFNPFMLANPTLPDLYMQTKSPQQLIDALYCAVQAIADYDNEQSTQININTKNIAELQDLFEQFQASGFDDYYREQIAKWIKDNLPELWDMFAAQVFFGLTCDGYFCAYVPQSWCDIVFDTGAMYGSEQYGRLILRYLVDGECVIDNTQPAYPVSDDTFNYILGLLDKQQGEIDEIISSGGSGYILPPASTDALGGVYIVSDSDFESYMGF